jgi:outer membrane biosynthesis protein TonB
MTYTSTRNLSISISVLLHLILLGLFFIISFSIDYPPKQYVELSFGTMNKSGSSGAIGTQVENVQEVAQKEQKVESTQKSTVEKKVDLPKAENTSDQNVIQPAEKKKDKTNKTKSEATQATNSKVNTEGKGNKAKGNGSFGYDIDWGGQGQRKIYSYSLPAYPEGVEKEIDIRLKFSILPDGTVGTIIPITKADTRLEDAAINSLRQWRFEPLDPSQKQTEQTAVIVFPYRLQ